MNRVSFDTRHSFSQEVQASGHTADEVLVLEAKDTVNLRAHDGLVLVMVQRHYINRSTISETKKGACDQ